ncbi:MAG: methyltransferase domain-containing protein [Clostridia bacterium]|nr:methyltransferase domain-containing protein [Clostridia bacterium]
MTTPDTASHDILGRALEAWHRQPRTMRLRVLSDRFGTSHTDVAHFFRTYPQMPELEKLALNHCKGSVLDIGAGAGCHSLSLLNQKKLPHPIDISPGAVRVMQARGLHNARQLDFYDIKNEKYDTLLMLMNGIGISGTLAGLEKTLQQAHNLLRPGGRLICDSSDIIYMLEQEDGSVMIDLAANYYGEVNYQFAYRSRKSEPFPWLYIHYDLLHEYANRFGFDCKKIADGEHYDYLAMLSRQ